MRSRKGEWRIRRRKQAVQSLHDFWHHALRLALQAWCFPSNARALARFNAGPTSRFARAYIRSMTPNKVPE